MMAIDEMMVFFRVFI